MRNNNKHPLELYYSPETQADYSLRFSRYIAALARYLGDVGFVFPHTDTRNNIEYDFDFYNVEYEYFVKVLRSPDQAKEWAALRDADDIEFIVDAEESQGRGTPCFDSISKSLLELAETFNALIFINNQLWVLDEDGWEKIPPYEHLRCLATINLLSERP